MELTRLRRHNNSFYTYQQKPKIWLGPRWLPPQTEAIFNGKDHHSFEIRICLKTEDSLSSFNNDKKKFLNKKWCKRIWFYFKQIQLVNAALMKYLPWQVLHKENTSSFANVILINEFLLEFPPKPMEAHHLTPADLVVWFFVNSSNYLYSDLENLGRRSF